MVIVRSVLFSLLLSLPSAFGSDPPEFSGDVLSEGGQCPVTQAPPAPGWIDADPDRFELYRHTGGTD